MKKLNEHQIKLLALITFTVVIAGWLLPLVGIVTKNSPLDWTISLVGAALALTYVVVTIISQRSS